MVSRLSLLYACIICWLLIVQQGPLLNEDEFFDAIEETLDKMDNLEEKLQNLEVDTKKLDSSSDKKDHRMYNQVSTY